jgi:hypothetical protein
MKSVVAELYRVFQPYRIGDDFVGCSDCVSPEETARLAAIPLRSLSVADLNRYARKAMTTWGEVTHFKYFLPRLLELSLDEFENFDTPEVLLGKLAYANWESWPAIEQAAVRDFLEAFWRHQLTSPGTFPADHRIGTVLGGLAQLHSSLIPLLDAWLSIEDQTAALHLCQLIDHSADDIMQTGRIRFLWGNPAKASEELTKWLATDAVQNYLDPFHAIVSGPFPYAFIQLEGICAAVNGAESDPGDAQSGLGLGVDPDARSNQS